MQEIAWTAICMIPTLRTPAVRDIVPLLSGTFGPMSVAMISIILAWVVPTVGFAILSCCAAHLPSQPPRYPFRTAANGVRKLEPYVVLTIVCLFLCFLSTALLVFGLLLGFVFDKGHTPGWNFYARGALTILALQGSLYIATARPYAGLTVIGILWGYGVLGQSLIGKPVPRYLEQMCGNDANTLSRLTL